MQQIPHLPPTIKCATCGAELHRACAKHALGKWYCKECYKKVKKQVKFEHMAQRASVFGTKKPCVGIRRL